MTCTFSFEGSNYFLDTFILLVFPSLSQHSENRWIAHTQIIALRYVSTYILPPKSPSSIGEYTINGWYWIDNLSIISTAQLSGIEAFLQNLGLFNLRTAKLHLSGWWCQAGKKVAIILSSSQAEIEIKHQPTNQLGMSQNITKQMDFILAPGPKSILTHQVKGVSIILITETMPQLPLSCGSWETLAPQGLPQLLRDS